MQGQEPLDYLPLWELFVATVVLVLLATATGYALGRWRHTGGEEAQKAPVGEIVAALLGLLALLLGFTFSLAATRFDARRSLVLEEANAIGTTWLRAELLPPAERDASRRLLRQYLEVRLAAVASGQVQQGVARSEELQGQLWRQAVAAGEKQPSSFLTGLYIASLNEVIDLHAKRVMHGLRLRIPFSIWAVLYLAAVLSLGAIGYHAGLAGARRLAAIVPLILTFSAVLLLIADLDRPQEGLFKVSQQSLMDLRQMMGGPGG